MSQTPNERTDGSDDKTEIFGENLPPSDVGKTQAYWQPAESAKTEILSVPQQFRPTPPPADKTVAYDAPAQPQYGQPPAFGSPIGGVAPQPQYGQPQAFGSQPAQPQYGQPSAFGSQPAQPQYGQPFGQTQQPPAFGQPPQPSYGNPPTYGQPQQPAQPQYGQPATFGQPPQYGQPSQPFGQPQQPAQPQYGQPSQPFGQPQYGQPPVSTQQPPQYGQPQQGFGQPMQPYGQLPQYGQPGVATSGMQPNLASLLAYLFSWVGGLVFLAIEKNNQFVRWNAAQSLVLGVAYFVVIIVYNIIVGVLNNATQSCYNDAFYLYYCHESAVVSLLHIVGSLFGLAFVILSIYLMVMAFQNRTIRLPFLAQYADRIAPRLFK